MTEGPLRGLCDEMLSRVEVPVETAVGQPGFLHDLGNSEAVHAVAADSRRSDVEDAVAARRLGRLRRTHDRSSSRGRDCLTTKMIPVLLIGMGDDRHLETRL